MSSSSTSARFIPALAGNIRVQIRTPHPDAVHPRARGEHCLALRTPRPCGGSSPRSRGTFPIWPHYRRPTRFIPALAGNMPGRRSLRCAATVHPRARGEHIARPRMRFPFLGSSPRSRGTSIQTLRRRISARFIPALAGNMPVMISASIPVAVHPRARGEHFSTVFAMEALNGSSPRSRGTYFS